MYEEKSIVEIAKIYKEIIGAEEYKEIEEIINKLIDTIIENGEKMEGKNYYYISKKLNFPEEIKVKREVKENEKKKIISISLPNIKFSKINPNGTLNYFDDEKNLFNNTTYFQEIVFNIGKILFYLLNGVEFSSKNQLMKHQNIRTFQVFLTLTLKYYTYFNVVDLKKLNNLKLNIEESLLEKEIKEIKNLSEISSIIPNKSIKNIELEIDNDYLYKGKDYFMSYNNGKGIIESSFSIKRKKSLEEKKFEDNKDKFFEQIKNKIGKKIDQIYNLFKGPIP